MPSGKNSQRYEESRLGSHPIFTKRSSFCESFVHLHAQGVVQHLERLHVLTQHGQLVWLPFARNKEPAVRTDKKRPCADDDTLRLLLRTGAGQVRECSPQDGNLTHDNAREASA